MGHPAIFVGHGNPMNSLAENSYTEGWRCLGEHIPWPRDNPVYLADDAWSETGKPFSD
jgi:aromatic ring-opening dioxygenase catalytic subunit (LigB family)